MKRLDGRSIILFFFSQFWGILMATFTILFSVWMLNNYERMTEVDIETMMNAIWLDMPLMSLLTLTIAGTLSAIWAALHHNFYKYEITESTFRKEYGILTKRSTEIPLVRVQDVSISRSILSRILGLSTLGIRTAGSSRTEGWLPGVAKEEAIKIKERLLKT